MLHDATITGNALDLLKQVQGNPHFRDTRLVGGTALALQIGHRRSDDLDCFGRVELEPAEVTQELKTYGPVSVRGSNRRMQRYVVRGVQLDVVDYDYPWLDAPVHSDGIRLASCRDIAAMKLAAITNRGGRKDFVDVFFLLQTFSLADMLAFYARKFSEGSAFAVLKSLVFFDDAEDEPMPAMLTPFDWAVARQSITDAVAAFSVGR